MAKSARAGYICPLPGAQQGTDSYGRAVLIGGEMSSKTETKPTTVTITKKELIDRIADKTGQKRVVVKTIVQSVLDEVVNGLGEGKRLEFRDFGVFEVRERKARTAQNPKTLERVEVPSKWSVRFKAGRLMRQATEQLGLKSSAKAPAPKPDTQVAAFTEAKPTTKRAAGVTRG